MTKTVGKQAIKLANECFKAMREEELVPTKSERRWTPPVCRAYSGMSCIHLRYLPTCEGCVIKRKKEGENDYKNKDT